jgi:LmbE family N-acetylglucosaminyl deacetylase
MHKNKTTSMVWTCTKDGGGETAKKGTEMATIREKEARQAQTYLGGGD